MNDMVGHIRSNLFMTIYAISDVYNKMLDQILENFPFQIQTYPNLPIYFVIRRGVLV